MKIYDISMKICYEMPVYKGREAKRPVMKVESDFTSSSVYESKITMNMHTGTHVDSALHMLPEGTTIDTLPLEKVITKCKVFDLQHVTGGISEEHLKEKDIVEGDFILLKTKNSYLDILENEFIFVDKTGASYLEQKKIKGVGIDSLGIERAQPEHETHKILLGADIVILEGLNLRDIEEDEYLLVAAPINVIGAEAAPARAVLIKEV
ncbi:cyclase family protein [Cellulosilyticum sp. I15G10I2]|uniref:cyclase family protein n=1 Tax=Cellulosilyticum sp. I15G10I2 TaxID=1892843 RepID=UPI00085C961D|nr:cyclase family protein [Cellulosilyticum sp. I15G10I2]